MSIRGRSGLRPRDGGRSPSGKAGGSETAGSGMKGSRRRSSTPCTGARRLLEQGRVEELEGAPGGLGEGYLRLTEAGAATVEGLATMQSATADDPAVEVERLGRRLRAAEQALSTEISDEELRRRCLPLLQTEPPYDRMIRTACFIMEMR